MIKNQRQYATTKKQVGLFQDALAQWSENSRPADVDPIIHRAQRDGLESQLDTLRSELGEYETLKKGLIETISLRSLEELPAGLIKARIARGLTQKDLAEKIGVKTQQVQRWEFEDYENVGFRFLVDIAHALDLDVSEVIRLPNKPRPAFIGLKELGIDKNFLRTRLVPMQFKWQLKDMSDSDLLVVASARLGTIFGCHIADDGTVANDGRFALVASGARFKIPADANTARVNAYALYARHLAEIVTKCINQPVRPIPRDWKELRAVLCGNAQPTFEQLLRGAWALGVPVLPLADPIRFHGVYWRIENRNVVILKQSMRYESRWAFDLIHELYHAGETPESQVIEAIELEATDPERRESDDEKRANEFAGNVLLNGLAEELYVKILELSGGHIDRLKKATLQVAHEANVNQGYLANYLAFRLKSEHFVEWWGAAANLQPDNQDPFETARRVFFEQLHGASITTENQELLVQALADPDVT